MRAGLSQLKPGPLGGHGRALAVFTAVDSNVLTYLVEAIEPAYDPTIGDPSIALERLAIVQSFIYGDVRFWVSPTVEVEYNRIRTPAKHLRHERTAWVLLEDVPLRGDQVALDARAQSLVAFHSDVDDCRIVAEAEEHRVESLLTRDDDLIAHLTARTPLALQYPSKLWQSLALPRGAKPRRTVQSLGSRSWWRH